jgi:REP element-mobilizing transposase RayT
MNRYNPNIHHRKSIRLKGYDYAQAGLYFITICCNRGGELHSPFGYIENGEMILNEYGQIAFDEWMKTPEIRPNVELGEFIVMPNHIHGIIRLLGRGELHSPHDRGICNMPQPPNETGIYDMPQSPNETGIYDMTQPPQETGINNMPQPPDNGGVCKTPLRSPSQTVGAIVRGYKSSVTKRLGLLGFNGKLWQRNYYEHIIRNEQSYQNISNYIINNPAKWQADKFYSK